MPIGKYPKPLISMSMRDKLKEELSVKGWKVQRLDDGMFIVTNGYTAFSHQHKQAALWLIDILNNQATNEVNK